MSASAVGGRREVELTFSHIHTHTHTHTHTLSLSLSQLVQLVELIQAFSSLHRRPQLYSSYLPRRLTSGFGLRAVQKKSRIIPQRHFLLCARPRQLHFWFFSLAGPCIGCSLASSFAAYCHSLSCPCPLCSGIRPSRCGLWYVSPEQPRCSILESLTGFAPSLSVCVSSSVLCSVNPPSSLPSITASTPAGGRRMPSARTRTSPRTGKSRS